MLNTYPKSRDESSEALKLEHCSKPVTLELNMCNEMDHTSNSLSLKAVVYYPNSFYQDAGFTTRRVGGS